MAEDSLNSIQLQQKLDAQKKELQELEQKQDVSSSSQPPFSLQEKQYNPAEDGGLFLSGMILVFSLFVIWVISRLIKAGFDSESLLKLFGTILIIVSAVFLIVAGYSDKQISPVVGLLGTIAGYILGKQQPEKKPQSTITRAMSPVTEDAQQVNQRDAPPSGGFGV